MLSPNCGNCDHYSFRLTKIAYGRNAVGMRYHKRGTVILSAILMPMMVRSICYKIVSLCVCLGRIDAYSEGHELNVCHHKAAIPPTEARRNELLWALLDDDVATALHPFTGEETFWQLNLDISIGGDITSGWMVHLDTMNIPCDHITTTVAYSTPHCCSSFPSVECGLVGTFQNTHFHSCVFSCAYRCGFNDSQTILMFHYLDYFGFDKNDSKLLNLNIKWMSKQMNFDLLSLRWAIQDIYIPLLCCVVLWFVLVLRVLFAQIFSEVTLKDVERSINYDKGWNVCILLWPYSACRGTGSWLINVGSMSIISVPNPLRLISQNK